NNDLPTLVLSLEKVQRQHPGLGERAELISNGALPWQATIDLANPVLPEEPGFVLLSADRRSLILPHGGLRQADGSGGPLGPADISVSVAGTPRTVVAGAPGAGQVQADASIGLLRFGSALPASGLVRVSYVLGQWERRVTPLSGTLRLDVWAADGSSCATLSDAAINALLAAPDAALASLHKLVLTDLSGVSFPDPNRARARGRTARFVFAYEHVVNRPDSSGGVIRRIPITTELLSIVIDPVTGVPTPQLSVEEG
ncbi:MAG: hypothetical protein RJA44_2479, partial [Pseudomonadota bacterium]